MNFDEIREMAMSFPGVEEHLAFGRPTLRVGKKFLACVAKINEDTLCLKLPDQREREYLLSTKPDIYYLTDHYADFGAILIRMPLVDQQELHGLIEQAWLMLAPKRLVTAYRAKEDAD